MTSFAERERRNYPCQLNQPVHLLCLPLHPGLSCAIWSKPWRISGQLGFRATYHDEEFAIVSRDGVDLHFNSYVDHPAGFHSVCWIGVSDSEALYQQYLPTNAVCSPLTAQPWGLQEFMIRDPFGNGILFAERIALTDANSQQEG